MDTLTPAVRTPTILVVDDDDFYESVLDGMLSQLTTAETITALSGKEALSKYKQLPSPPELIISDVFMPDMDGFELLNELIQLRFPGALLFISGVDSSMLVLAKALAKQNGIKIIDAFSKPVSLDELSKALEQVGLLKT